MSDESRKLAQATDHADEDGETVFDSPETDTTREEPAYLLEYCDDLALLLIRLSQGERLVLPPPSNHPMKMRDRVTFMVQAPRK